MKATNTAVSLLVLVSFILYVVIELKIPCDENKRGKNPGDLKLQEQRDSLTKINTQLINYYQKLQQETDSLHRELSKTKINTNQLKTKQHETIITIDHYNNNELYRFFTSFNTDDLR